MTILSHSSHYDIAVTVLTQCHSCHSDALVTVAALETYAASDQMRRLLRPSKHKHKRTHKHVEAWKLGRKLTEPFQTEFLMETNSKHGGGGGAFPRFFEWQWSGVEGEREEYITRARHWS